MGEYNMQLLVGKILDFVMKSRLLATGVIVLVSPVEDKNKPLDDVEKRVYRRRALLLLTGWSVVTFVLRLLGLTEASNAVVLAIALCGIMALLGKLKFIV